MDNRFEVGACGFEKTVAKITANGRHVLIIGDQVKTSCPINRERLLQGPLPHSPEPPCPPTKRDAPDRPTAAINGGLARVQAKWPPQVELLRPVGHFCAGECPAAAARRWRRFDPPRFCVR